jgi:short-subunit dehydrogenase
VTLVARRKDRLDALASDLRASSTRQALVFARDLALVETATDWVAEAEAALGPIDVLVNNAGIQIIEPAETMDVARGEELLRLNVHAPLRLTRAVLPGMLARQSGCIVDIASMAAITPAPGMYYYNASKAALAVASEGLRAELRGTGVHVLTVYPGPVDTELGQRGFERYEPSLTTKWLPVGTAPELARLVRRAVLRRSARLTYPRSYAVAQWFPTLARWFTGRFSPAIRRLPP